MSKPAKYFGTMLAFCSVLACQTPAQAQLQETPQTPFLVAQVLGCPRAEVIESRETASFYVYICQGQNGYVFYRGVDKSNGSQINLPASTDRNGVWFAVNGDYTYRLTSSSLVVLQGNTVILREAFY